MRNLVVKCRECGAETDGLAFVEVPEGLLKAWNKIIPLASTGWREKTLWAIHIIGSFLFMFAAGWFLGIFWKPELLRLVIYIVTSVAVEQILLGLFCKPGTGRFKVFASKAAKFLEENERTLGIDRNTEFVVLPMPTTYYHNRPVFLVRDDGSVRVQVNAWFALVSPYEETRFSWGTPI